MRRNLFNEVYLDFSDSVADHVAMEDLLGEDLNAIVEFDPDERTWMAEILDDCGTVFFVEDYPTSAELVGALQEAGIDQVEVL